MIQILDLFQNFEDLSIQIDVSFFVFEIFEIEIINIFLGNIVEGDENIIIKKLVFVKEIVNFFDRLSRELLFVKQNNLEVSFEKQKD